MTNDPIREAARLLDAARQLQADCEALWNAYPVHAFDPVRMLSYDLRVFILNMLESDSGQVTK